MRQFEGPFYLFCAFTLAGTSVIAARIVSGALGPFVIAAASLFFALLLLLPLCAGQLLRMVRGLSLTELFSLICQAVFGIFLFRVCLLNGLRYTSAGEAGILTGAAPAITALLALIILKERLSGRNLAGIFGTVAGILLLQGFWPGNGLSIEHMGGNLLILGAAVCESVFNILSRISSAGPNDQKTGPLARTAGVTVIALVLCLIPALLDPSIKNLAAIGLKGWLALLWYGIVVTAVAFICWYAGIKRCTAFTAAAFSGMMPFAAMLLSVFVLGDYTGWQQWTGGALVVAGMLLIGSGGRQGRRTALRSDTDIESGSIIDA